MRRSGRAIAAVLVVKALGSALALGLGFRAVSDDDFSRVVIAEQFAAMPRLDPTGSSWLPFPFWLQGAVFCVLGRSLLLARAFSFVLGLLSALLVYAGARRLATSERGALWGACAAAVFPWSARLSVATVPELWTACLAFYATSLLVGDEDRGAPRLWGALALFCATLSRYDAWPLALAFSAFCLKDLLVSRPLSRSSRMALLSCALLSLLGPALWVLWNHLSRGHALDFLERVAMYRRALGEGHSDSRFGRLFAYPLVMLRHEPELFGIFLLLLGVSIRSFSSLRALLRGYGRPFAIACFQLFFLSAALVKDGAPTHHAERALLYCLLLMAVCAGDLGAALWGQFDSARRKRLFAATLLLTTFSVLVVRRLFPSESFLARADEVSVGLSARDLVPKGERLLLDVVDYGYFATMAAFARPEDVVLDRDLDPRKPKAESSFQSVGALREKIEASHATFLVGPADSAALREVATLRYASGAIALWSVSAQGSAPSKRGEAP